MATNTWLNFVKFVIYEFCHPSVINKELSSHTHSVDFPFLNCFCCSHRFHSTSTNNRNVNEFFNMRNVIKVTVKWHIHWWMSPIPSIICTIVSIKHIIAGILQIFCCLFAFFHISSNFGKFFARNCSYAEILCFRNNRITKRNWIILSAKCFYCFNNFDRETIAIFETTTIFISSLICICSSKLIKKIAFMNSMDFHTINSGIFTHFSSFCKSIYHFFDFFFS